MRFRTDAAVCSTFIVNLIFLKIKLFIIQTKNTKPVRGERYITKEDLENLEMRTPAPIYENEPTNERSVDVIDNNIIPSTIITFKEQ